LKRAKKTIKRALKIETTGDCLALKFVLKRFFWGGGVSFSKISWAELLNEGGYYNLYFNALDRIKEITVKKPYFLNNYLYFRARILGHQISITGNWKIKIQKALQVKVWLINF